MPLPPREEGIAELKDWLKTNGAVFDKVNRNTINIIDKYYNRYYVLLPTSILTVNYNYALIIHKYILPYVLWLLE